MQYLEKLNVVHRNLQAKVIMLGDNNVAKISGFLLAKQITAGSYCKVEKGNERGKYFGVFFS
jgi:hypothetical protein